MIIDSHCHLHDEKYALDLNEVLARAKSAKVSHMISIGCDIETTRKAKALAEKIDNVYYSAGFHPHEAKFLSDEALHELEILAQNPKCVAIGECGLDYYYEHSSKDEQKRAFKQQIALARKLSLPLVIHLRDAIEDFLIILNEHKDYAHRVLMHCFSGTLAEAKTLESLGCFISLSCIITFKKPGELLLVAQSVAANRLLIETDCPYLAPHPHRGERNEPAYIGYTLKAIAQARGEDESAIEEQIAQNTMNFFGLKI